MKPVFGPSYAKYYDLLYSDKDYAKECNAIVRLLKPSASKKSRILDFTCGTGGHAIELAKRGFQVVGTDYSPDMIRIAKGKSSSVQFYVSDMLKGTWKGKFDAAISMFDSVDYLPNLGSLKLAFANVQRHLRPGSLLIFQFWNGAAVLRLGCEPRRKVIKDRGVEIIRSALPRMEPMEQRCVIRYMITVKEGASAPRRFTETHEVMYFFKPQIEQLLLESGFRLTKLCILSDIEKEANENDWSIVAVARVI